MRRKVKQWCAVLCCVAMLGSQGIMAFAEADTAAAEELIREESLEEDTEKETEAEVTEVQEETEAVTEQETEENTEEAGIAETETEAVIMPQAGEADEPAAAYSIGYAAYMQGTGWQDAKSNGAVAGLPGSGKRLEAFRVSADGAEGLSVEYQAHVSGIGWQGWKRNGADAGTTGQSRAIEAIQVRLAGDQKADYSVCYRVYASGYGWLGWAVDGEIAGTTGLKCPIEAMEIRLIKNGESLPGSSENHYIPGLWEMSYRQIGESTKVTVIPEAAKQLAEEKQADAVVITAAMSYNGKITQTVSMEKALQEIPENGFTMDLKDYGKFSLKAEFKKGGKITAVKETQIGIGASEYNIAPISATSPVTVFSLSLWDITKKENGDTIPTIVMLGRPSAYDWDALPEGVYGMPYLSEALIKKTSDYDAFAAYVKDLYEISPDATFHMYLNDIDCDIIHQNIYANGIPEGQYTLTLMSDGSATYNLFNQTYSGADAASVNQKLVEEWNAAKAYAYANGKVMSGWVRHGHMEDFYAAVTAEPGAEWWVARTNLFKSGDDNALANEAAGRAIRKNISTMLTDLQGKGDKVVSEFKALYNFNDEYFAKAEAEGKKAMMILGTYVNNEKNFEDYVHLTELYYGDDYVYYYKGHPNTPTGMYPEKQQQLNDLDLIDVDSSIAAELILFFNPTLSLSGYGTSTFNSADDEMACGLYNSTKASALAASGVDYSGIDWFASSLNGNKTYEGLYDEENPCYLVEFSDAILEKEAFEFAVYDAKRGSLKYYKTEDGQYQLVKEVIGESHENLVSYSAHVSKTGWQNNVTEGMTAGTVGEAKAVEALKAELTNCEYTGDIQYRAYVAKKGWQSWVKNGAIAGTTGQALAMEAVSMRLTGEMAEHYDLYYRVHSQSYGWLDWAKNGAVAGTIERSKRMEAIEIRLVAKGGKAPGSTATPAVIPQGVFYQSHVQTYGWETSWKNNGQLSGTSGQAKRLESMKIKLMNMEAEGSIEYRTHIQTYGWETGWKKDGQMSGTSGQAKRLEAIQIRLSGEMSEKYDVYYRVHAQTYGWLGWAKNGESAGTEGLAKRLEAIEIVLVEKGAEAPGRTDRAFIKK